MSGWGPLRIVLLVVGLGGAALALGYFLKVPVATATWPFPVTPLTYDFLAAYTLGSAVALLWVAATGELVGLLPLGLTTATAYGGLGLTLIPLASNDSRLWPNVGLSLGLFLIGVVAVVYGLRQITRDRRTTPRPLLIVYAIVAVLLFLLGVSLVLRMPDVLPWDIDLDNGTLVGWFFVGSGVYFAFALVRRAWPNATGQLAALLAYDVILALPLILHWPVAKPAHLLVLAMYIAVVVSSLVIGAYVFFVHPRYRWGSTG